MTPSTEGEGREADEAKGEHSSAIVQWPDGEIDDWW